MIKNKMVNIYFILLGAILVAVPSLVFADDATQLYGVLYPLYDKFLLPAGTVLAGLVIMYGGIIYASSSGEPSKIQLAKEYIFGAISGLVLLFAGSEIITLIVGK